MKRSYVQILGAMAVLLAAALLLPAGRAAAHAAYDHSTPAQDEVVPTAPSQVDVYFKQDVFKVAGAYYVRVFDDQATQMSDGDGVVDDNDRKHITATVTSTLPDGRYIVRWMNTSDEDGDEAEGAFCFYINVQPTAADTAECAGLNPTEEPAATGSPGATTQATSAATSATTPEASPTVAPEPNNKDNGSNTGVIVGVIVAVAVVVVVVGGAALYLRRPRA